MRTYAITRASGQVSLSVNGQTLSPRPPKPLPIVHSPEFDFGTSGPGSAQLALAILCDHFEHEAAASEITAVLRVTKAVQNDGRPEHAAMRVHEAFKKHVIAKPEVCTRVMPEPGERDTSRTVWTLSSSDIRGALGAIYPALASMTRPAADDGLHALGVATGMRLEALRAVAASLRTFNAELTDREIVTFLEAIAPTKEPPVVVAKPAPVKAEPRDPSKHASGVVGPVAFGKPAQTEILSASK